MCISRIISAAFYVLTIVAVGTAIGLYSVFDRVECVSDVVPLSLRDWLLAAVVIFGSVSVFLAGVQCVECYGKACGSLRLSVVLMTLAALTSSATVSVGWAIQMTVGATCKEANLAWLINSTLVSGVASESETLERVMRYPLLWTSTLFVLVLFTSVALGHVWLATSRAWAVWRAPDAVHFHELVDMGE